jgi:hypothetical protein
LGFCFVPLEPLLHCSIDRLLVTAMSHINKINYDKAANVTKSQLAGDFLSGLNICLEKDFINVL